MSVILQVREQKVTAEEIVPLLANYQLLPQLLREMIIDQAIAPFGCTPEEAEKACQAFYLQQSLKTDAERQAWLRRRGMTPEQVRKLVTRALRLEKFKQATWETQIDAYFEKRKPQLDRVIYSVIRTKDSGIAQELYFRLQAGEQSFAELAPKYSTGQEARTKGIVGPVELGKLHPSLAKLLSVTQPGQLLPPTPIDQWFVILRLEKILFAELNDVTRWQLRHELFLKWLGQQVAELNPMNDCQEDGNLLPM
ncbi:peptidylprolyl isomerase [Fischerella thermalis]|jgi:parvulin-like peptidyl-prolyl isomerase|uniref:peptidylprolyl isomerase n=2 Tax=Fischerella TaxID=1190 RepID=G6FZ32_9CYAN|nr:peptidylprolyl isomerase [Fischerella thermalis]PMB02650.1 peptidylprolyl isomerase [Fischerella thermalis CCMEE 5273]PMB05110.1 peptidylprolyl isomerase [Fischerella thermalis CCMEE 5328]EHC09050.1 parvulin-like peptidyl-prolyl isomerase-like protein [Fischerella thermalis JSC-11]MBF1988040.1 peptidylprolyl isomerase [Fischerella thermalis M58_A2018_009]MBF2060178.1 peptidylprolyl isomerase [Fischerella thermalis M66_A2018_004]